MSKPRSVGLTESSDRGTVDGMTRPHLGFRARAPQLLLRVAIGLAALAAGCNTLLGNTEVERDVLDTRPDLQGDARANAPQDSDAQLPLPTLPPDAAAPSTTACPPPTCATSADCPTQQVCISMGDNDGGALTRACRKTCEAGVGCPAYESCVVGVEQSACIPTGTSCYASCKRVCGTSCVDWFSDRANCGRCGTSCPVGKVCVGGACS